jgi:LmbE family N-acetylglucosaminyl deacetylase
MRFLNFNKVLCLSPHPDDVEISMMGSIIKSTDTHFDILCLTKGGAKGFDETNELDRRGEIREVWKEASCNNISLFNSKYNYFEDTNEPGWINYIENEFIKKNKYDCIFIPTADDSMFEHRYVSGFGAPLCRASRIGLIEYHISSTLNTWQPNLFISVKKEYNTKLTALKHFKSQSGKGYFKKQILDAFHSNFQCSKRGLNLVEQFKVIEIFGGIG